MALKDAAPSGAASRPVCDGCHAAPRLPQPHVLFNRTVRNNIALADSGMLMERVIAAAGSKCAFDR